MSASFSFRRITFFLLAACSFNTILKVKFIEKFGNKPPTESENLYSFSLSHLSQTGFFNSPEKNKDQQLKKFEAALKAECERKKVAFDPEEVENYKKFLDLY